MRDRFIDTLDQSGDMKKSKPELRGILRDDVGRTMIDVNVRRFTFGIDEKKNPDGYRAAVVAGTADAMKYYNNLEAAVIREWNERNRPPAATEQQGGTAQTQDTRPQAAPPGGYQLYGGSR